MGVRPLRQGAALDLDFISPPRQSEETTAAAKLADIQHKRGLERKAKNQWDDAIAAFRKAIELSPKQAEFYADLGLALKTRNQFDDANAAFRKAVELNPRVAQIYVDRGLALSNQNRLEDAIAEWRNAIDVDANCADAHANLCWVLQNKGEWDKAAPEIQKAIELNPRVGWYHNNYGWGLEHQGQLEEALAEYRKALQLPDDGGKAAGNLKNLEPLVARIPRLEEIRKGEATPVDAAECLQLVQLAKRKKQWLLATHLYENAFTYKPDLVVGHRYDAACYAALAAVSQGKDDKLDDKERIRLRKQAVEWLRADLAHWTKQAASEKASDRELMQTRLKHWQNDTDLHGLRDKDALAKLPEDEREACQKLWADVTELLQKAGSTK